MTNLGLSLADTAMLLVAVVSGAALIRVDVREHRLPNRLTGGAAATLLAVAAVDAVVRSDASRWAPMLLTALAMAAAGYLAAVISPSGFGLGDVKLLGVIGLALGHLDPETVVVWLLALSAASVLWLLLAPRLDRKSDPTVPWRKRHIAFGPPLVVAWWLVYLLVVTVAVVRA